MSGKERKMNIFIKVQFSKMLKRIFQSVMSPYVLLHYIVLNYLLLGVKSVILH